jgi:predicted transcriptional regulator
LEKNMSKKKPPKLTRREEQIMDVIFRLGEASVNDIMEHLTESPTSGAVRRMMNLLFAKGVVEYRHDGPKKIYRSTTKRNIAGEKALKHVTDTFFAGSAVQTMASLFDSSSLKLSEEEKEMLNSLIEKAKEQGR